jgi:flagellar protein FlaG
VASVSISHMILFIASMLVAASVAGVLTDTVGELSSAIDDQGVQVSQEVRTDIEIISDSGSSAVWNDTGNGNTTLHVKNTGTELLPSDGEAINVFVNGQFETGVTVTLLGGATSWRPGEVVELEIGSDDVSDGDDVRVKVIVNGDEEIFRFRAEQ